MNSRASSSLNVSPQGFSRRTTWAPCRLAISVIRSQKKPLANMAHFMPGSTKLETAASIPPLPVPETASVTPCWAPNTTLSSPCTSSMTLKKYGSTWLTMGLARVSYTRGCTCVGPGPKRYRRGGCNGENFCAPMLSVVVAILSFFWLSPVRSCKAEAPCRGGPLPAVAGPSLWSGLLHSAVRPASRSTHCCSHSDKQSLSPPKFRLRRLDSPTDVEPRSRLVLTFPASLH